MVETTPLFVDQANDIIRDAKDIVKSDVYLDRTKEFVPAGNNPVYPDVLVTVRTVRQSLGRCKTDLRAEEKRLIGTLCRARTVVGALECFLSDEENAEYAIKEDVETFVEGDVDDSCFSSETRLARNASTLKSSTLTLWRSSSRLRKRTMAPKTKTNMAAKHRRRFEDLGAESEGEE